MMRLIQFGSSTWINPDDVVAVTLRSGGYDSVIELRSGTRFHVSGTPKETVAKLTESAG